MAAIGVDNPTLLDVAKTLDSSGRLARIVNLMKQRSPIIEDAVWTEANGRVKHTVTSIVGLPTPSWGRINKGVATSKHKTAQYDETMGLLESASEADVRLMDVYGSKFAAYRSSLDDQHLLGLAQELETGVIYHSTGLTPEKLNGLAVRYDATTQLSGGSQVILCDGSPSGSDQTSAWFITWGEDATHMIYPEGSMAGIKSEDMGKVDVSDGTNSYPAFKTYHRWWPGLVVEDYRQNVRVCNIDTSAISASGTNLVEGLIRGYHQIHTPTSRTRLYVNRTVATYLHLQSRKEFVNNPSVVKSFEGREVLTFMGIPVRVSDAILSTEAVVS